MRAVDQSSSRTSPSASEGTVTMRVSPCRDVLSVVSSMADLTFATGPAPRMATRTFVAGAFPRRYFTDSRGFPRTRMCRFSWATILYAQFVSVTACGNCRYSGCRYGLGFYSS